eukprot:gnl/Dysnectes_brevis/549_a606_5253.p1 GENE.gnl/Dysnectes_brevis/549_a606_5253~~gnl/Dysnectes_brevis/549_a606_5253.p1  ORF type:complete len:358 (+),score=108.26 gnl/Dysnectes_brevis/549_a606_5253:45-1118(+)
MPPSDTTITPQDTGKYESAGEVVQETMNQLLHEIAIGKTISELCKFGDDTMVALLSKRYKKNKKMAKGIALPTCISFDKIIGHYSPSDSTLDHSLKAGEILRIDMGAHIDGFPAQLATTIVVPAKGVRLDRTKIKGKLADCMAACHVACETVSKALRPGVRSRTIVSLIEDVARHFDVKPIQGVYSSVVGRYMLESDRVIPCVAEMPEFDPATPHTVHANTVYVIDIAMSAGSGIAHEAPIPAFVFDRVPDAEKVRLSSRSARALLNDIDTRLNMFPFTPRQFSVPKLGLSDLITNRLIDGYQIAKEDTSEFAHMRLTVAVFPKRRKKLTTVPVPCRVLSSVPLTDKMKETLGIEKE